MAWLWSKPARRQRQRGSIYCHIKSLSTLKPCQYNQHPAKRGSYDISLIWNLICESLFLFQGVQLVTTICSLSEVSDNLVSVTQEATLLMIVKCLWMWEMLGSCGIMIQQREAEQSVLVQHWDLRYSCHAHEIVCLPLTLTVNQRALLEQSSVCKMELVSSQLW